MKNHNNLTDSQIHNAKGFSTARKRSVSTKNHINGVEWVKSNYTSSVLIVVPADSQGHLHHRFFCLYSSNDAVKYAVYFKVTSSTAMAAPTGYGGLIAVDLTSSGANSTAIQVGTALQTALNSHADFTATRDGETGQVTLTGLTTASPAVDFDAGITINITDTEVVNEVLHTNADGHIKFTPFSSIMSGLNLLSDKAYTHTQSVSATVWVVTHSLDKYASVTVVDSAGTVVIGQVDYNSLNQITLTFKATFSGKAYFN